MRLVEKGVLEKGDRNHASIINFEHISHFITPLLLINFEQINADWASETIVSDDKLVFSKCGKYIVLWAGKICRHLPAKS